ncbi:MAG: hypothetical protein L6416_06930, partial [Candidatus Omnitrophica bacterium]|nr:hypothetical protein [Candidatus Omnitrophota bacterium]
MKRSPFWKILSGCIIVQFLFSFACFAGGTKQVKEEKPQELAVYFDKNYIDNHYFASQRIGDGDAIEFDD